jgi:hypothetical protein
MAPRFLLLSGQEAQDRADWFFMQADEASALIVRGAWEKLRGEMG